MVVPAGNLIPAGKAGGCIQWNKIKIKSYLKRCRCPWLEGQSLFLFTICSQEGPDLNIFLLYDYIIDRDTKKSTPPSNVSSLPNVLFIIFPPSKEPFRMNTGKPVLVLKGSFMYYGFPRTWAGGAE